MRQNAAPMVPTFDERVALRAADMSPAERRVVRYFQGNREEVLISSAAALAAKAETSDATVVRATRALGFSGLDELRRALADELRTSLSPAERLSRTLDEVGDDLFAAFQDDAGDPRGVSGEPAPEHYSGVVREGCRRCCRRRARPRFWSRAIERRRRLPCYPARQIWADRRGSLEHRPSVRGRFAAAARGRSGRHPGLWPRLCRARRAPGRNRPAASAIVSHNGSPRRYVTTPGGFRFTRCRAGGRRCSACIRPRSALSRHCLLVWRRDARQRHSPVSKRSTKRARNWAEE